jgi:hypothetical protein
MTDFETFTLLISLLALIVSMYTFTQQRKLQREANELQRANSELAKRHLELLKEDEKRSRQAELTLMLSGSQGEHILTLKNIGRATASSVNIESLGDFSPLLPQQINSRFPLNILAPGDQVILNAVIYIESPDRFKLRILWNDPDGTGRKQSFELAR